MLMVVRDVQVDSMDRAVANPVQTVAGMMNVIENLDSVLWDVKTATEDPIADSLVTVDVQPVIPGIRVFRVWTETMVSNVKIFVRQRVAGTSRAIKSAVSVVNVLLESMVRTVRNPVVGIVSLLAAVQGMGNV
jgi:hypothetical protein